jgi:hypothetical protein
MRKPGQGLRAAVRDGHVGDGVPEEGLEMRLAGLEVDVGVFARAIDVLEEGEAIETHLQALAAEVTGKALHEEAQDFVHVDDQEGPVSSQAEGGEFGRRVVWRSEGHELVLG